MIAAYAWNGMPIEGSDIMRCILAIGRALHFPIDVVLAPLLTHIVGVAQSVVSYIHHINKNTRFTTDIVTW